LLNMIIALTVLGWVSYARFVRGMVLSLKEREFVESARCLRFGNVHILFKHILPNCLGPIVVLSSMDMAGVILMAAGLSFLGLGVQGSFPEWGLMLNQGKDYLRIAPHLATCPGLAIMVAALAFNLLGDGLRDLLQGEGVHFN
jgi:peptide/nickel transport system permease protein